MIALVLVGVGNAELSQSIFESSALAHVAGQHQWIDRAGMRPRQHPATQAGVVFKIGRFHDLDHRLDLGVTELAQVYMCFFLACTGCPPQEHITGRLHGALAHHHPLPGMLPRAGAAIRLQHGLARLLELQA